MIAMGYDKDIVDDLPTYNDLEFSEERVARFPDGEQPDQNTSLDFSMQTLEVYECYIRIDEDEDGIAELRRIVYCGSEILEDEECDYVPFHSICPIPIPHKFIGQSLADRVMDIQLETSNVTAAAVAAMMKSNSGKLELIARIFAETGVKSLFKGILHLMTKYQNKPKIIRMRGQYATFDPRTWANEYDISVNVGLGSGDREQKLTMLQMVLAKQEQIIQQYGPANPLVSVGQYRNTLAKFIEAAGFKDASEFMNEITPEQNAALSQPQPPSPDAQAQVAEMLAQVEREKTQAKAQIDAAKLDLERQTLEAEYTRKGIEMQMKNQKDSAELRIKEAELAVKQLQAVLAMDLADEDTKNKQTELTLKALRELGTLTRGMA